MARRNVVSPPAFQPVSVGIVADTHGLLRPEALDALRGCDRLIHAGDLGKPEIFEGLSRLAPTVAIRGNVDRGVWAEAFPATLTMSIGATNIHVLHDLHDLTADLVADEDLDAVISGHSHRPSLEKREGVLYVNPGSAGPRRFSLPVTVARLIIGPVTLQADVIDVLGNRPLLTLTVERRRRSA